MTAQEKLRKQRTDLYQDAVLRWLTARRDFPFMNHPEPVAAEYQLEDWYAAKLKAVTVADFYREEMI